MSQDLFAAARRGDLGALSAQRGRLLEEFEEYPHRIWAAAIEADQVDVLDLCLEAGLDPNGTAEERPLLQAAAFQARRCIARLLEAGADPTAVDEDGRNLLLIAAQQGDADLAELVLERGGNPFDENAGFFLSVASASFKAVISKYRKRARDEFARQAEALRAMKANGPPIPLAADEIRRPIPFERGATLLHLAAKRDRADWIREFVAVGVPVDALDQTPHEREYGRGTVLEMSIVFGGRTALMVASVAGSIEAARALIEAGADVRRADASGETSLHMACRSRREELVKLLLDAGADPNAATREGGTPLLVTGYFGTAEMAAMLIRAGADVGRPDMDGFTPILAACWEGRTEVAETLLAAGATLDAGAGEEGDVWDAIHTEKRTKLLRRLLPYLDLNPRDRHESPLATAAQYHHVEAIPLMIEAGARPKLGERITLADAYDASPQAKARALKALQALGQAATDEDLVRAVWQNDDAVIRQLVAMGANPAAGLHEARDAKTVDLLLELGAQVDALNGQGRCALHAATERGDVEIVRQLLKQGANPRLADPVGIRPVDLAMLGSAELQACFRDVEPERGRVATLRLIQMFSDYGPPTLEEVDAALREGADPNVQAGRGFDVAALAAARRLWAVADRLIEGGASPTWEYEVFRRVQDLPMAADESFHEAVALVEAELREDAIPVEGGEGSVTFRLASLVEARQAELLSAGENATAANLRAGFETAPAVAETWRPRIPSYWCGSWRGHPVANPQILLVPTTNPYTVVALIQPHAGEHEVGVFEILRFLRKHESLGWRLIGIGYDTVDLEFARLPDDLKAFAQELYEFCPDLIDQGFPSLAELAKSLRATRRLHLWWD